MSIPEFIVLAVVNLTLTAIIVRKWGLVSAEGFCMAYVFMAVLTDNVELVFDYLVRPETLILGVYEFEFRIYPTLVHITGLLVLIVGLLIFSPRPRSVTLELSESRARLLRRTGVAVTVLGFGLLAIACYFADAYPGSNFFEALDVFRTEAVSFGGFWYRGPDIAVFGLALVMASVRTNSRNARASLLAILMAMMLVSFFARTNKGGFELAVLWAAMVLHIYNPRGLKLLFKPTLLAVAGAVAFFGIGFKNLMLRGSLDRTESPVLVLKSSFDTISARWGDNSTYRGYSQFINRLPEYRHRFDNYKVGRYTLTSCVPRALDPTKPDHPFRGLGFMIYPDYHAYAMETPAVGLMGSVFADAGFLSLVGYLFAAAAFLGVFRRLATAKRPSLHCHMAYVMFTLFGGLSAESGIIGLIYVLIMACSVLGAAYLMVLVVGMGIQNIKNIPSRTIPTYYLKNA